MVQQMLQPTQTAKRADRGHSLRPQQDEAIRAKAEFQGWVSEPMICGTITMAQQSTKRSDESAT
jgi:hypothetical protein